MNFQPIQIILVLVFALALMRTIWRARQGGLKLSEFLFWFLVWTLAIAVVILPDSTFYFAKIFGVGRGADFVVYAALVVLFLLLFKIMSKLDALEQNLTKIVRAEALKDVKERK